MLALVRGKQQDGAVTVPDEDVAARGRSIFERLRAEQEAAQAAATAVPSAEETSARIAWSALELVDERGSAAPAVANADPIPPTVDDIGASQGGQGADDVANGGATGDQAVAATLGSSMASDPGAGPDALENQGAEGATTPVGDAAVEEAPSAEAPPAAPREDATRAAAGTIAVPEDAAAMSVVTPPAVARAVPAAEPAVSVPPVMPDLPPLPAPPAAVASEPAPEPARPSFARPLPRIIAIANQKGGVGKTTTTVNLGASLAVLGYRVLVVDLDPQGNATTGLGINSRNLEHSIYDVVLHDVPLEDCVEPTTLRNLYVAPATIDLAGAEIELVPAFSRELRLRRALEEVREDYDFVLIDCPPSLGLLTVNGLAAATEVLVPIQCEYYALEGLGQLLRNVNLVQSNLNPKLELSAIVLTMYDARTKLAEQVADEVRTHFGPKVCRNVVPRTVRLSEAPSFGQPIIVFDPSSRGALAYRELAKEVSGGAPQRAG
jgi:chromosome partitioning protein